jgi:hypothetical protein
MRNTTPKKSTPNRFPVIPENLNKNFRELRRLNNHQLPPNNYQTKQPSKETRYTQLFRRIEHIYTSCSETTSLYTQLSSQKERIGFKIRLGKGKEAETQTQSEQNL